MSGARKARLLAALVGTLVGVPASAAKITEFTIPTTTSLPKPIVAGPDGRLWFCESGSAPHGNNIGAITTSGSFTEYPIPTANAGCAGLAWVGTGTGVLLYFSEYNTGQVESVDASGTFGGSPIATGLFGPVGLADGHDGRLWIATSNVSAMLAQKILTFATNLGYPMNTPATTPTNIAYGSDGQMWVTQNTGSKVGACPRTVISCLDHATAASAGPFDIAAGVDGNLWFTEQNANAIGRLTHGGTLMEFPIPTLASSPTGITAGPDGSLWFTEQSGNKIGRITLAGTISEFPIPTANSAPYGITTGPDGNIWFCEYFGNKIGRLLVGPDGDVDGNGIVDVADVFYLINFLFAGGPPPK